MSTNFILSKEYATDFTDIIDELLISLLFSLKKGDYEDIEKLLTYLEKTISLMQSLDFEEVGA